MKNSYNKLAQSIYEKCIEEIDIIIKQKLNEAYESSDIRKWAHNKSAVLYNYIRWDENGGLADCKLIDINKGSISDKESFVINVGQEYKYSEIREMMKNFNFNRSMHQALYTIISNIYNAVPQLRHDNDFWWADKNYESAKKYEEMNIRVINRKFETDSYGREYVSDFTFKIDNIRVKEGDNLWFHSFGVIFAADIDNKTDIKSVIAISPKSLNIESAKNHIRKLNKYTKSSTFKTPSKRRENKTWYPFTANILKTIYKEGIQILRRNPDYDIKQALEYQLKFAQLFDDPIFYKWVEKKEPELYDILIKAGFTKNA